MRKLFSKMIVAIVLSTAPLTAFAITSEPAEACLKCRFNYFPPTYSCVTASSDAWTFCVPLQVGCQVSGSCIN
jgi:hypothetical protein